MNSLRNDQSQFEVYLTYMIPPIFGRWDHHIGNGVVPIFVCALFCSGFIVYHPESELYFQP